MEEKYTGACRKWQSNAPWHPRTFHLAILSLQLIDKVLSPLPGLILNSPTEWYPAPSPRGSSPPPATGFAPVLKISDCGCWPFFSVEGTFSLVHFVTGKCSPSLLCLLQIRHAAFVRWLEDSEYFPSPSVFRLFESLSVTFSVSVSFGKSTRSDTHCSLCFGQFECKSCKSSKSEFGEL